MATNASAEPPSAARGEGVAWTCRYAAEDFSLRCALADLAPAPHGPGQVEDPRLPPLVRQIRGDPQSLAGTLVTIPLWSEPTDPASVLLLARSVMCGPGAGSGCRTEFHGLAPAQAAPTHPAATRTARGLARQTRATVAPNPAAPPLAPVERLALNSSPPAEGPPAPAGSSR